MDLVPEHNLKPDSAIAPTRNKKLDTLSALFPDLDRFTLLDILTGLDGDTDRTIETILCMNEDPLVQHSLSSQDRPPFPPRHSPIQNHSHFIHPSQRIYSDSPGHSSVKTTRKNQNGYSYQDEYVNGNGNIGRNGGSAYDNDKGIQRTQRGNHMDDHPDAHLQQIEGSLSRTGKDTETHSSDIFEEFHIAQLLLTSKYGSRFLGTKVELDTNSATPLPNHLPKQVLHPSSKDSYANIIKSTQSSDTTRKLDLHRVSLDDHYARRSSLDEIQDFCIRYDIESFLINHKLPREMITPKFCQKMNSLSRENREKSLELFLKQRENFENLPAKDLMRHIDTMLTTWKIHSNYETYSKKKRRLRKEKESPFHYTPRCTVAVSKNGSLNIIFEPLTIELGNRTFRKFQPSRFLRVSFKPPLGESKCQRERKRNVYESVLNDGITIAGRHFYFLGMSASQLREGSCIFFAQRGYDIAEISCMEVYKWMGNFMRIPTVSKLVARMGQCFSHSVPTVTLDLNTEVEHIPDLMTKNEDLFTDGCGDISPELAADVWNVMSSVTASKIKFVPSVFQIRFGGCKGVVAVNESLRGRRLIRVRPSMLKFDFPDDPPPELRTIDVLDVSQNRVGYLNRQLIAALDALGVQSEKFFDLLYETASVLKSVVEGTERSTIDLRIIRDLNETIDDLISVGFSPKEAYIQALVLKYLKGESSNLVEKARIRVAESRLLFGVCDQSNDEGKVNLLPGQVFCQLSKVNSNGEMIGKQCLEGKVLVCRAPVTHKGDIRIYEALRCPGLENLLDCIVFPIVGERPHPLDCSAGDLDGDKYFISWDRDFTSIRPVEPLDLSFMTSHVREPPLLPDCDWETVYPECQRYLLDSLWDNCVGILGNEHMSAVDSQGFDHPETIELVKLFRRAIDQAKTGDQVQVPKKRRVQPHYLNPDGKHYHSNSILGRLYDECKVLIRPMQEAKMKDRIEIDMDLLRPGRGRFQGDANTLRYLYNQELRFLHEKKCDFEHFNQEVTKIELKYRTIFESDCRNEDDLLDKASAFYEETYKACKGQKNPSPTTIGFPWICAQKHLMTLKLKAKTAT